MSMKNLAFGLALLAGVSVACTGTDDPPAPDVAGRSVTSQDLGASSPTPSRIYTVRWDPRAYDARRSGAALAACTRLPGAEDGGTAESFPPINSVVFTGTVEQQRAVERCLAALPDARFATRG
jgi:hypothetical protein